jgi:7-carboxy-7-deazaguanine synthase
VRIAEIFYSIQGEGRLLGTPSIFVRTSGCNLRCVWCDTPYTSWRPEGKEWSIGDILRQIQQFPARHVVITGGEPVLAPEIEELTSRIKDSGAHITVESAATIFKPLTCDLISLSPKLSNSTPWKRDGGKFAGLHEARRINLAVIQKFVERYDFQLKFVADQPRDLTEIQEILGKLSHVDPTRVLLMAQGKTRKELRDKAQWLTELCKRHGYGFTPRLQIELFGNRRGT